MLFYILLVAQILICLSLGGLILIQRSEGGALGMGGGPSGFMSARGAGNLLTRLTAIFAVLFFANSIGLTIYGNLNGKPKSAVDQVDTSKLPVNTNLLTTPPATTAPTQAAPASAAPSLNDLPLAGTAAPSSAPVAVKPTGPASSAGPSINLSMPSQTTTGKLDLPKADDAPKAAPKPAKTASSSSSTASVRTSSAAPSSSASTAPVTPASSQ